MSVADQITRINTAKADIKTAIEAKGVTVPSSAKIDTYDDYIAAIPTQSDLTFRKCQYLFYKGRLLNNADQIILSPNESGSSPSEKIMDYTGLFEGNGRITTPSGYTQAGLGLKGWNKVTNAKIILDRCFKDVVFEGIETEAEGILALPKYDSLNQITSCDDLLNGSRCRNGSVTGRIRLGDDTNKWYFNNCTSYKRAFKNTQNLMFNIQNERIKYQYLYINQDNTNVSECFYGTTFYNPFGPGDRLLIEGQSNTQHNIIIDDNCEGFIRNTNATYIGFDYIKLNTLTDKPMSYYYGGGLDDSHYDNTVTSLYFDSYSQIGGTSSSDPATFGWFANMRALTSLPSLGCPTGNHTMNYMFYNCQSLQAGGPGGRFYSAPYTTTQASPTGNNIDKEEYYYTYANISSNIQRINGLEVSYIGGTGSDMFHMLKPFGDGSDSSFDNTSIVEVVFTQTNGTWKANVPVGDYNINKYADVYIDLRPLKNLNTNNWYSNMPDNSGNVNTSRPEGQQGYIHLILDDNVTYESSVYDHLNSIGVKLEYSVL